MEEQMVERSRSRRFRVPVVCLAVALSILFQGVAWGQTVFSEDWESGSVDPTKWVAYGSPSSAIVSPGYDSIFCLDPEGDSDCPSGVYSVQTFSLQNTMLTFVARALTLASAHQRVAVGFATDELINPPCDSEGGLKTLVAINVRADALNGPLRRYIQLSLATNDAPEIFQENIDDQWHDYGLRILDTGHVEYYRDGELGLRPRSCRARRAAEAQGGLAALQRPTTTRLMRRSSSR
jgi:hypothetical protein